MRKRPMWLLAAAALAGSFLGCGGSDLPPPRAAAPDDEEKPPPSSLQAPPVQPAAEPEPAPESGVDPQPSEVAAGDRKPPAPVLPPRMMNQNDRRADIIADLQKIAGALAAYVSDNGGAFPSSQVGTLSWRVALLPYLGEKDLYDQFDPAKPWDDPATNWRLLQHMPAVFHSFHSDPGLTNYLAIGGDLGCFAGGVKIGQVVDGLDDTVVVVVMDDGNAVPWTKPTDVDAVLLTRYKGYGTFAQKSFPTLLANGQVVELDRDINPNTLLAGCTYARNDRAMLFNHFESLSAAVIEGPSRAEVVASAASRNRDDEEKPPPADFPGGAGTANGGRQQPKRELNPVPDEVSQRGAMELVKQLFLSRYEDADNNLDKREIAREMVTKSGQLGDDLAGKYAMLTTAHRIALEADDLETAGAATSALIETYDVDSYSMKVALLKKTARLTQESSFDTRIIEDAYELAKEAAAKDDYGTAKEMAGVALAAARRQANRDEVTRIARLNSDLQKMDAAYRRVQLALSKTGGAKPNPATSELVGEYYCFTKGQWDRGLPHLARSEDPSLRRAAELDLTAPADAQQQLELADLWWALQENARPPQDRNIARRSLYWYQLAVNELPEGLPRLKAELRVKEIEALGGP